MFYQDIQLINFRNYTDAYFSFDKKYNLIVGKNGAGKTNLLEALYFSAFLRGFYHLQGILNHNAKVFLLKLSTNEYELKVSYEAGKTKKVFKDNRLITSAGEHIGSQPTVAILPQDIELIRGSPGKMRAWIHKLLSQKSEEYLKHLTVYTRNLKARNQLLKTQRVHSTLLEICEEKMLEAARKISEFHRNFISEILPFFKQYYAELNEYEGVEVQYFPSVEEYTEETWRESLEKDFQAGHTTVGIHRDKFQVFLQGRPAKFYASQGQTKSLAIALKLAEYELIKNRKTPVLLIDDIAEKLDAERLWKLFSVLEHKIPGQVFITDTSVGRVQEFVGGKVIRL